MNEHEGYWSAVDEDKSSNLGEEVSVKKLSFPEMYDVVLPNRNWATAFVGELHRINDTRCVSNYDICTLLGLDPPEKEVMWGQDWRGAFSGGFIFPEKLPCGASVIHMGKPTAYKDPSYLERVDYFPWSKYCDCPCEDVRNSEGELCSRACGDIDKDY